MGGGAKLKAAVGSMVVVMVDVGPQSPLELTTVEDQQPVQALTPQRADEPLGMSVGVGSPEGRADHAHALGLKDRVERRAELRVAVVDDEAHAPLLVGEGHREV